MKIEKALQCLLMFSYRVGERNIVQTVSLSIFSVLIFSVLSKVIIIIVINRVYGLGHKIK